MRNAVALLCLSSLTAFAQFTSIGSFDVAAREGGYVVMYAEVQVSPSTGEGAGRVYAQAYDADGGMVGGRVEVDSTPGDQGGSTIACTGGHCLLRYGNWVTGNNFVPRTRLLPAGAALNQSVAFDAGFNIDTCSIDATDAGFRSLCDNGAQLQVRTLNTSGALLQTRTVSTMNRYADGVLRLVPGATGDLLIYASDWLPGGATSKHVLVIDAAGTVLNDRTFSPPLLAVTDHIAATPDGWVGWFLGMPMRPELQPYVFSPNASFNNPLAGPGPRKIEDSAGDALFDGRDVVLTHRGCESAPSPGDCPDFFAASVARSDTAGRFIDAQWVRLNAPLPSSAPEIATQGDGTALAVMTSREEEPVTRIYLRKLHTQLLRRGSATAGGTCTTGSDCANGFCAGGVCCNVGCSGACETCKASEGASADGTCGRRVEGGTCDDGNQQTVNDRCMANVCMGQAAVVDAGTDAGLRDAGLVDAGFDAGQDPPLMPPPVLDGGTGTTEEPKKCGCSGSGIEGALFCAVLLALRLRRRSV